MGMRVWYAGIYIVARRAKRPVGTCCSTPQKWQPGVSRLLRTVANGLYISSPALPINQSFHLFLTKTRGKEIGYVLGRLVVAV